MAQSYFSLTLLSLICAFPQGAGGEVQWPDQQVITVNASINVHVAVPHATWQCDPQALEAFQEKAAHYQLTWKEAVTQVPITSGNEIVFLRAKHLASSQAVLPPELMSGKWCSITAYNPFGQLAPDAQNSMRNHELRSALEALHPKPLQVLASWSGMGDWREEQWLENCRVHLSSAHAHL